MSPAASTVEELRALAEKVSAVTGKLKKTPGLVEGHVERIATSIDQVLRDYGGRSYRQYRNLVRDLDAVAAEVARHSKAGAISPKVLRILDAALLRIRKRDFFMGRKLLDRLGKLRAQAQERERMLAEYREGYRALEREVSRLRTERDRLRSVQRPPVSEEDVSALKSRLEEANRNLAHAWIAELHEIPCGTVITTLLEASKDRRLLLPHIPEGDAMALSDLLAQVGPIREAFGRRGVHGLLEALSYSDAKLAHLAGDGRPLKTALQANLAWLKAVTAPGDALPRLSLDLSLVELRNRIEALSRLSERLHASEKAREKLAEIRTQLESGDLERGQEADRAYRVHGEAARVAWAGSLQKAVGELQATLDARLRDLTGLTAPDRLGGRAAEG